MDDSATSQTEVRHSAWPPIAAAIAALIGLGDALYLTINHYTGEKVPCSVTGGCEQVLTSAWSEIGGVPLSIFGAVAYFIAFSLAVLVAFGNRKLWNLYGALAAGMTAFSAFLVYLQASVIGAFCQFCLLSAATSTTLFILYGISLLFKKK